MQPISVGLYHLDGRIRGSYVYLLMCEDQAKIKMKVGQSDRPLERLHGILTGCPLSPGLFAIAELPTRKLAFEVEKELHDEFKEWHLVREWFEFPISDKPQFNAAWKRVFQGYSSPSWKLSWTKFSVARILAERRRRLSYVRATAAKHGLTAT